MARPLTSAERESLGGSAYELSLRGKSQRRIAAELNIHHSTVGSLLREQIQYRRKERRDTVHSLLDGFDAAIGECWERLGHIPKSSAGPAAPQLVNAINSIMRSKLDVLGYKAPTKSQSWVHHSNGAQLERLSEEELEHWYEFLNRVFPDSAEGGELSKEEGTAIVVRELEPHRNGRS